MDRLASEGPLDAMWVQLPYTSLAFYCGHRLTYLRSWCIFPAGKRGRLWWDGYYVDAKGTKENTTTTAPQRKRQKQQRRNAGITVVRWKLSVDASGGSTHKSSGGNTNTPPGVGQTNIHPLRHRVISIERVVFLCIPCVHSVLLYFPKKRNSSGRSQSFCSSGVEHNAVLIEGGGRSHIKGPLEGAA